MSQAASYKMETLDPEKKDLSVNTNGIDAEAGTLSVPIGEVDAALEFLQKEGPAVMSEMDEKKLVRKIDFMIMPLMWTCYNLQYLDKVLSMNDLASAKSL
jgi:hypothetical protein